MNCPKCNHKMTLLQIFESKYLKDICHGLYFCDDCNEHFFRSGINLEMTLENTEETGILKFTNLK